MIDGPLKGQLWEITGMPPVYVPEHQIHEPIPLSRSYWTHTWMIMGRGINVLSIHPDWRDIPSETLWEMIIGDGAKQAAV